MRRYPDSFENRMPVVNPTYEQHILKPPRENVTHGMIPDIEVISSNDRNFTLYPAEGNYVVQLKDTYRHVTSVTLFNASIPNTAYLISKRNNMIYFRENCDVPIAVEIPEGDYSPSALKQAIADAMTNSSCSNSTYTVDINCLTNKFTISSDMAGGIFSLDFYCRSEPHESRTRAVYPPRSIGKILGFPRKDFMYATGRVNVSGSTISGIGTKFTTEFKTGDKFRVCGCNAIFTVDPLNPVNDVSMTATPDIPCADIPDALVYLGSHTAPYKYDLSSDPFIILDILELENIRSNSTPIDRAFAVIPMVFPQNTKNFVLPLSGISPYKKYFNPPLAKLDRLTVKFKDADGNIVDFNGIQHFMEFRITTVNAQGAYDTVPAL